MQGQLQEGSAQPCVEEAFSADSRRCQAEGSSQLCTAPVCTLGPLQLWSKRGEATRRGLQLA